MEHNTSTNHENGNDANRLLAAAAIWWNRLSPLKREFFESKYGIIDDNKINDIYKIHTDWLSTNVQLTTSAPIAQNTCYGLPFHDNALDGLCKIHN